MSEFIFPYDGGIYETVPKKFGHTWFEDDTITIGNSTTEWITSDTMADVEVPESTLDKLEKP